MAIASWASRNGNDVCLGKYGFVCAGVRELGMFDIFKWLDDFEKCFSS